MNLSLKPAPVLRFRLSISSNARFTLADVTTLATQLLRRIIKRKNTEEFKKDIVLIFEKGTYSVLLLGKFYSIKNRLSMNRYTDIPP